MTRDWVCLMYHDVAAAPVGVSGGKEHFSVTAETFGRHLDTLKALGLRVCSIGQALATTEPRVAISFDDGDLGQYQRAFPALAQRGMSATFFVTTSWIGTPGYVSWPQLREMHAGGMSIQSHTHTHPFLSELDDARLREELRQAKTALDEGLGQDTDQIALPGGDAPSRDHQAVITDSGYRVVATSRWGVNHEDDHALPAWIRRCTVRGAPPEGWLERVVRGDPWIGLPRVVREGALHQLRASLGPTRYARWRRWFLGMVGGTRTTSAPPPGS